MSIDEIDKRIETKFDSLLRDRLMSRDNMIIPRHTHNRVDSPQISSNDLIPYRLVTNTPDTINAQTGTIYLTETGDSGMWIFLNNDWRFLSFVNSQVSAFNTGQSIPDSTPTTIIFDDVRYDPSMEYDDTTGIFTPNQSGSYIICANVSFDSSAGVLGSPIELGISVSSGSPYTVKSYTTDSLDPVTAQITYIVYFGTGVSFSIEATQYSGASRDIIPADTFLSVKKFAI